MYFDVLWVVTFQLIILIVLRGTTISKKQMVAQQSWSASSRYISIIPPPNYFEVNTILEAEDQRSAALVLNPYSNDLIKARHANNSTTSGSQLLGTPCRRSNLNSHSSGTVRRFRAASFSLARVIETCGPRLRIRLVGTDDRNDYWFLVDSDQIRPYPSGSPLQPPFGYMHNHLVWNRTLKKATEGTRFADASWFISQPPDPEDNYFQVNDKLEAVDRRNTQLICPASVGAVNGHHILINFDGWSGAFDYWARFDSRELFPVGWCKSANYPLQPPGPNIIRSPTIHSTPTFLYSHKSVSQASSVSQKSSCRLYPESKIRGAKTNRTSSFPRKKLKLSRKVKSHTTLVKSNSHGKIENAVPHKSSYQLTAKQSLNIRNSLPPVLSKPNFRSIASDPMDNSTNERVNLFVGKNSLSTTQVDLSIRSMSSPSVVPPVLEDASDSSNIFYSSSPPDHPPQIEAPEFLGDSTTGCHRRFDGPSDCVVRLQAKSSLVAMSSVLHPYEPELKSWKVVTKTKRSSKQPKLKRGNRNPKKFHEIGRKFKVVNDGITSPVQCNYEYPDPLSSQLKGFSDLGQNYQKSLAYPEDTPSLHKSKSSNSITSYKDDSALTCTPVFIADKKNQFKSENDRTLPTLMGSSLVYQSHVSHDIIHSNACYFDEMNSPTHDSLSVETSDTPLWFSGKLESSSNKSVYPVYSHQNVDSLDSQSQTTHLPSSTVSPSSLDLGSFPFPNPTQWTIEEVYNYITARDATLLEAAEKFKHHEIDGQALLLLSMESLRNYMKIKLGPALKMVHLINRLKRGLL
ncbi:Sex comb on midleg-like protein 2 [Schistosoma japonicum]|nr:Sex comb on midleg-like protein 2 [Schistosoma japonicum]